MSAITAIQAWKDALSGYADEYAALVNRVDVDLMAMTDEQLMILREQTRQPSETNCGWAVFRVAEIVRGEINAEKYRRAAVRDQLLAASTEPGSTEQ